MLMIFITNVNEFKSNLTLFGFVGVILTILLVSIVRYERTYYRYLCPDWYEYLFIHKNWHHTVAWCWYRLCFTRNISALWEVYICKSKIVYIDRDGDLYFHFTKSVDNSVKKSFFIINGKMLYITFFHSSNTCVTI